MRKIRGNKQASSFRRGALGRLLAFGKPYLGLAVVAMLCSLVQAAAALVIPIFAGRAIDHIVGVGNVDFDAVFRYIILIFVALGVNVILHYSAAALINTAAFNTIRDLRIALFYKLNNVPIKFIDSSSGGDIMARVTADTEQMADGLVHGATNMFAGVVTAGGTLGLMFSINWQIALFVAVITPLSIFISYLIAKSCQSKFSKQAALRGRLATITEEYVGNQKLVMAFDYSAAAQQKFETTNDNLKTVGTKATFHSSLPNPSSRLVNNLVYAIAVAMGALFIIGGTSGVGTGAGAVLTIGSLSIILAYANQYARPFNEITGIVTELQTAFAGARRIFDILDVSEEASDKSFPTLEACIADQRQKVLESRGLLGEAFEGSAFGGVRGDAEISDVCFSYTETPFITGLNLSVQRGQRIAIVGPTGCGKTTIINLLMRFYDPDSGRICIDGADICKVTRKSLRRNFGMVLQESWVFRGTVRDNIAYSRPEATEEEIIAAAKNADIHSFIMRLKDGYDTVLSEGGMGLSQGQMQLLCIARIMLSLPPMLILDEATSSIDTRTEAIVQAAFSKMMQGRTSFIIAHRLSTIREADLILVLNNGQIIEQGTHAELLEQKGFYHDLYTAQFE